MRPALLFAFAALLVVLDLSSKAWATAELANAAHPLVWTQMQGKTPQAALAERGIVGQEAQKIADSGALARLQRSTWKATEVVSTAMLGKHVVVTAGSGYANPRAARMLNRHVGKPLVEVLADGWRVDSERVAGLLAQAWQVSDLPVEFDKPLLAGEALASFDRTIVLLPNWLHFVYAENPGAAFSFLVDAPAMLRHLLFTVISSLAALALCWWLFKGHGGTVLTSWSLAAILGGAIGNVIDRLHYHVVIDFIYMFFVSDGKVHGWPVYNVADMGITVGVILIAAESLFRRQPAPVAPATAQPPA